MERNEEGERDGKEKSFPIWQMDDCLASTSSLEA